MKIYRKKKEPTRVQIFLNLAIALPISILIVMRLLHYDKYLWLLNNKILLTIGMVGIFILSSFCVYRLLIGVRSRLHFAKYSSMKKVKLSSIIFLLLTIMIVSMQYICYLHNLELLDKNSTVYKSEMRQEVAHIEKEIQRCARYLDIYTAIIGEINPTIKYTHHIYDDEIIVVVNNDTLMITPKGLGDEPLDRIDKSEFDHTIRSFGVVLNGESFDITHPQSEMLMRTIQRNDSIMPDILINLLHDKIGFYTDRLETTKISLLQREEMGISFTTYWMNSLFNNTNIQSSYSHIVVKILSMIQIILIAFASGYIFKHLYKVLDNE